MPHLSKTSYLEFLTCPKNAWLKKHKPELVSSFELSPFEKSLVANGNLVEEWARKLFPKGVLIESSGETAALETVKYLEAKHPAIFQATFITDKFLARADVLEYDSSSDSWNLYEIKGTNSLKEKTDDRDHIDDATFQYITLSDCGLKIGSINIIHLNKEYIRGEEINVQKLFAIDNISEKIFEREEATREKMSEATQALFQEDERAVSCNCLYKGRSNHCSTFSYAHPEVPAYSVHDLYRIGLSPKKLASLVDDNIFNISDVPSDFKLSVAQQNQIYVYKTGGPMIDLISIKAEFEALKYPLYFFDYETYPAAIPLFKGFKPYQHIPFQFSLHVLRSSSSKPEHYEYLHLDNTNPTEGIISALRKYIGSKGSIIVWHKPFEQTRNSELALLSPGDSGFLNNINNRIYDLMDIFSKQLYVHPKFKGSTSIKKVLPVLAPSLSYQELEIKEGGSAMEAWFEKIFNASSENEKNETAQNLLKYCKLDTYAMYVIWKALKNLE